LAGLVECAESHVLVAEHGIPPLKYIYNTR